MPGAASRSPRVTVEDYLAAERRTSVKHEFVDGHVYPMGGASDRHNIIAGNLFAALHAHLPEQCQVFMADMKLRVRLEKAELFYYPDIIVSCSTADRAPYFSEKPVLLAEVLSESTERTDRTEKLDYKRIDTLVEYVIIAQDAPLIEVHRRPESWSRTVYGPEAGLTLASVGLTTSLDALYRRSGVLPR